MIRYSILAVNRSSVAILFIGLLGLFVAGIADAGVNHWTTNGPEGGFIQVLAIDPDTPTTIYAGTNTSGVFKSMDGGGSWTAMNTGLTSSIVHALAIDPDTPTTVYAATRGDGVFKSTNGGENWTAMNTGLTGSIGTIYTLAIDPKTPTTVYAAGSAGVVFKSTDGGENWTPMDTGMVYTGWLWVNAVYALAIDPKTPTTVYAGTNCYGAYKTTNGGENWTAIHTGDYVQVLAIDPDTPTTVYAGTGRGLFKSTNGGENWTPMNTGMDTGLASGNLVYGLAIDPKTPTTVYAASDGGLFKSTNGGENWTAVNMGLIYTPVPALAIDPKTPETVYAGTVRDGVFKSTNGGENWTAVNMGLIYTPVPALAIDPKTPATIYAGTSYSGVYDFYNAYGSGYGGVVFKSTNGGENWTAMNTGLPSRIVSIHALAIDPGTPTTVYAGTDGGGVFKTTNGGENWTAMNTGLPSSNGNIYALAIDPMTPTTVYAGVYALGSGAGAGGVFKTTNGGENWTAMNTGLTNTFVECLAIDPMTPTTVYAGVYGWGSGAGAGGLFKTTNGGQNWTAMNRGLTDTFVQSLAVDPMTPTTVYATACRVFKSTNGGENWTALKRGLRNICVRSLAIDPKTPETVYAVTSGGVFKSTNGGQNWTAMNTGLENIDVRSLAIDPMKPGTLYAGTWGNSVFKFVPYEGYAVNPEQGTIGTEITITGSGFGAEKGNVLVGTVGLKILEWSDSSIRCQLTRALSPGTYDVTIRPKGSSPIIVEDGFAAMPPDINSTEPISGSTGDEITINGLFFGTKKGKVALGGKTCRVLSWTMNPTTGESEIHFAVPKGLNPGTYELTLTTAKVGSATVNFTVE